MAHFKPLIEESNATIGIKAFDSTSEFDAIFLQQYRPTPIIDGRYTESFQPRKILIYHWAKLIS